MTIRTFRANSVADALLQVKKELGPGAVILHTRTYKVGGVLGVGAKSVTEITATKDMHVESRLPRREAVRSGAAQPVIDGRAGVRDHGALGARPGGVARAGAGVGSDVGAPAGAAAGAGINARGQGGAGVRADVPPAEGPIAAQLRDELSAIRRLVGRLVHSGAGPVAETPETLQRCYLRLLESEVAAEIADAVVNEVRGELGHGGGRDAEAVHRVVLEKLTGYIPASDSVPEDSRPDDGRPLTIALVGPTGVGKTTTIAKLAAAYKLRHGKRVGLLTCDTYRIAAVEQLRTYAGIIGLPLRVALTPAEIEHGCEAMRDCDVVLIDTAGRAPGDAGRLDELARFLERARPHQVHLVLSSAAGQASMSQAVANFASVKPSHVIFTKLDEAVNFGVLVNVGRRINARLSYVTTGQEVPDHIERGDAARLARLVLENGGSLAPTAPLLGGAR